MNTLTISNIFSNFDFYQTHYLNILQDPQQYYTPVAEAVIRVWPVGEQQLHLGDLLQLWFSSKWIVNDNFLLLPDHTVRGRKVKSKRPNDLYVFQLAGSALSGTNTSKAWSISEQKVVTLSVASVFQYLCTFQGTTRLEVSQQQLIQALTKAI